MRRHQTAQWPRIDIVAGHTNWAVDLARHITGFGCPRPRWQPHQLAIDGHEALLDVGRLTLACLGRVGAGKPINPDTGLGPVDGRGRASRVVSSHAQPQAIFHHIDAVRHNHTVSQPIFHQDDAGLSGRQLPARVWNRRLSPVPVSRAGPAVGLQIIDTNLAARKVTGDGEELILPCSCQLTGVYETNRHPAQAAKQCRVENQTDSSRHYGFHSCFSSRSRD